MMLVKKEKSSLIREIFEIKLIGFGNWQGVRNMGKEGLKDDSQVSDINYQIKGYDIYCDGKHQRRSPFFLEDQGSVFRHTEVSLLFWMALLKNSSLIPECSF